MSVRSNKQQRLSNPTAAHSRNEIAEIMKRAKVLRMHSVERAGSLDWKLRRLLYDPAKILSPWIRAGMTVADFGCGPGFFARTAAELVGPSGTVIAIDIQEGMLAMLRERIVGMPIEQRIHPHRCDPDHLGISDQLDLVYSFYVMHEVPDRERVIRELCELIKSGGTIFFMDFVVTMSKPSFEELERLVLEEGFRTIARPRHFLSRGVVCLKE
jgi:ubiquinone/menaquinone biosynthesis C-methylase UbiE